MTRDQATAAEPFLRQEYDALCRYVHRIVGDREDSIELVQEACLRFCETRGGAAGEEHERALLFRIARNLAIDLIRRRQTRASFQWTNLVVMRPEDPEKALLADERRRLARAAFEQLEERHRHDWDHSVATREQIEGWIRHAREIDAVLAINAGPMASGRLRPEDEQALLKLG